MSTGDEASFFGKMLEWFGLAGLGVSGVLWRRQDQQADKYDLLAQKVNSFATADDLVEHERREDEHFASLYRRMDARDDEARQHREEVIKSISTLIERVGPAKGRRR